MDQVNTPFLRSIEADHNARVAADLDAFSATSDCVPLRTSLHCAAKGLRLGQCYRQLIYTVQTFANGR